MEIIEVIRRDHRQVLSQLDQLVAMASSTRSPQAAEWSERMQNFKRGFLSHNRTEEAVLYDRLRLQPLMFGEIEARMAEHRLIEESLDDVAEGEITRLRQLIGFHFLEEESRMFAQIEAELDWVERERLGEDYEALHSEIEPVVVLSRLREFRSETDWA